MLLGALGGQFLDLACLGTSHSDALLTVPKSSIHKTSPWSLSVSPAYFEETKYRGQTPSLGSPACPWSGL